MLAVSIHQIVDGITGNNINVDHDSWLLFKKIRLAELIVGVSMLIIYLWVLISRSEKSNKDKFRIVICLLLLALGIWAMDARIKEIANFKPTDNLPLPLASKIAIGIFFSIFVVAVFKRDGKPKE